MSSPPLGLIVGLIGLAGGASVLLVRGVRANRHPWHHLLAFLVPAVTALSYTAMLFGQGVTVLSTGRVYYWARWADALFGATVLVLNTALVALPRPSARRAPLLAGLAAANIITMASGLFAGFSTLSAARWTWYAIGSGAYAAVLWILFRRVPSEARRQDASPARRRIFWRLAAFLIGVALLYPLWWVVTPLGLGWVDHGTSLLVFAGLDVLSKAVYGWVLVRAVHRIPADSPKPGAAPAPSAPSSHRQLDADPK
jgi:bacteriorhodopsin